MNKPTFKPAYYNEFVRSKQCVTFLGVDHLSVQIIRRLKGVCLLCNQAAENYDLTFCIGREVWVLYGNPFHFTAAMQLARTVQWLGATKVSVIRVKSALAQEMSRDDLSF